MDNKMQILVMRVMALGVFKEQDRHALRTMSVNTLQEIIRLVKPNELPVFRTSAVTNAFILDDDEDDQMAPLSLGDVIRNRRR